MKFRVERDALADAVAWTAKSLPSRPSVPVLAGVLMRVAEGALTVSGFDLMIDDGLHSYEAGICLLENSFDRLKKNGMYIIENVSIKDMFLFRAYFSDHSYKADFVNLYRQRANMDNNRLIVIRK